MLLLKNNPEKMPLSDDKTGALKISIIRFFIVLIALFVFYTIPKDYLGDTFPICLYRIIFNKKCIGCGTTRAVWSVLHLELNEAMQYNKLILISFPLLVGCTFSWIIKKN
jgi:hypothetical protein